MVMGFFIKTWGYVFSLLPFSCLAILTQFLAYVFVSIPSCRRRILLSNLKHAFPYWNDVRTKSVAKKSAARMFEMGFFSLTYPFLSKDKLRRTLLFPEKVERELHDLRKSGRPLLILVPHVCLFETLVTSPYFRPQRGKTLGAIYRPNKNAELDLWINRARLKTGMKTFARKEGLLRARNHLRKGNWLIVLFDQNAGIKGVKATFLDRLCSISRLPDLLAKQPDLACVYVSPRRHSFFQAKLEVKNLEVKPQGTHLDAHRLLEQEIRDCPDGLPEWLWSHGKWKTNDMPHEFFHLQTNKKSKIDFPDLTRKTKLWIRMPNWLGDIIMAIPLIRSVRSSRPDAEITLLCQKQYASFLESLRIAEHIIPLPDKRGIGYFASFLAWRKHYPDAMLLFTNSFRGDLEAFIIGAKLRFGMVRKHLRPLLNARWKVPEEMTQFHQTRVWEGLLRNFGLKEETDLSALPRLEGPKGKSIEKIRIGLAPGSNNTPSKRWPVESWIVICENLISESQGKEITLELFGTNQDKSLCASIKHSLPSSLCIDHAGKTSLVELMNHFRQLDVLLCNDSGAMHLANAAGTPVVAIFGPTDPSITGPIYESTSIAIQSNTADPIESIEPKTVVKEALQVIGLQV